MQWEEIVVTYAYSLDCSLKHHPHSIYNFYKVQKKSLLYSARATCLFYAPFFLPFLELR